MSVTQQVHWIHFEAFIAETYVQLATTKIMCYFTGGSTLAGVHELNARMRAPRTVLYGGLTSELV